MSDPTLKERIASEMRDALKGGDRVRLGALRMLSAAVTNREKEVLHGLSDDEVREVAAKEVKKRTESIDAFEGAGRQELADKERAERDAIVGYAPAFLDDAAIDALIDEAIASTGATSEKELGRVMGLVMSKARGRVDGNVVQAKVRARLSGAGNPT
ncbi:MAG TPA: GatB/YqeY domain-containing protein [Actinomycetota bacterium]|nr:GatB/YqeY domain-containing protein [Actinomycetota bacterium]